MRGNIEVTTNVCSKCRQFEKFERNSFIWGLGDFLMVLMTFGMWLPIKFIYNAFVNPWRCSNCGARE